MWRGLLFVFVDTPSVRSLESIWSYFCIIFAYSHGCYPHLDRDNSGPRRVQPIITAVHLFFLLRYMTRKRPGRSQSNASVTPSLQLPNPRLTGVSLSSPRLMPRCVSVIERPSARHHHHASSHAHPAKCNVEQKRTMGKERSVVYQSRTLYSFRLGDPFMTIAGPALWPCGPNPLPSLRTVSGSD